MRTNSENLKAKPHAANHNNAESPDIMSMSVPQTLALLDVKPEVGLTSADVDSRREASGYNEVAETKGHPLRAIGP